MRSFNSKILLFGEYTVLLNKKSLCLPFEDYNGCLKINNYSDKKKVIDKSFIKYLQSNCKFLNNERLIDDVNKGLYFDSSIPLGFGLGSSGALCASIYDNYKNSTSEYSFNSDFLKSLREKLIIMENFFHKKSSGIDPLVSLLDKAILTSEDSSIRTLELIKIKNVFFNSNISLYLYNSGVNRISSNFIDLFYKLLNSKDFNKQFSHLSEFTEEMIDLIIEKSQMDNSSIDFELIKCISRKQLEHFDKFIPTNVKKFWIEGLENDSFYFKLCGAGGGGFFQVYTKNNKENEVLNILKHQLCIKAI